MPCSAACRPATRWACSTSGLPPPARGADPVEPGQRAGTDRPGLRRPRPDRLGNRPRTGAARLAPANMVLVLTGGVVADRLSRRRVMLASDAVRCLTQAATALLLATGKARLWELLALQAAHGAAAAFFDPAATGLLPRPSVPAASSRPTRCSACPAAPPASSARSARGSWSRPWAPVSPWASTRQASRPAPGRSPCSDRPGPPRPAALRASSRSLPTGGASSVPDRGCGHPFSTSPC
jgi:Transmembrane secretion effector